MKLEGHLPLSIYCSLPILSNQVKVKFLKTNKSKSIKSNEIDF